MLKDDIDDMLESIPDDMDRKEAMEALKSAKSFVLMYSTPDGNYGRLTMQQGIPVSDMSVFSFMCSLAAQEFAETVTEIMGGSNADQDD